LFELVDLLDELLPFIIITICFLGLICGGGIGSANVSRHDFFGDFKMESLTFSFRFVFLSFVAVGRFFVFFNVFVRTFKLLVKFRKNDLFKIYFFVQF
jgi:hypothetical protein